MILSARGLGKRYADAAGGRAVAGVDFDIGAAEFTSIVGRSGSGKSTLLAMLGGLMRPSEGRVMLDGVDLASLGEARLAAFRSRHVGFVFQFPSLLPNLCVADNVALPALLSKASSEDAARARAVDLLRAVGLAHRVTAFPGTLSGGEARRVAIARALVNAPRVVLADEPTGDLDQESEAGIVALLERLHDEQRFALVVVSHNPAIAHRADRVLAMSAGSLAPAVAQPRRIAPRAAERRTPQPAGSLPEVRSHRRLGEAFRAQAGAVLFGCAVALSVLLLADSLVARYQRMRAQAHADRLAALETMALSGLRADVKGMAALGNGQYTVTLELSNAQRERAIYVMSPSVHAYVQIGRQWVEVPLSPVDRPEASVQEITGRQQYRYAFRADVTNYAKLFSHYMHVRFVNTMLISPARTPGDELFERTDSYYVYLKPWNVHDREILQTAKFDGAPPLWISMPPH